MTVGQLFVLFGLKINKQQFAQANKALKVLKAAAAVTGIVELGRDLVGLAEHAAESATHIVSLSQAMGMTTEQTQLWGYVAQQSGSNVKELSVGISMFLGNLRKLATGQAGKQLRETFASIGLSAADAKLAMSGPDGLQAVLMKTADLLHKMGNTGNTAALGRSLFGARAGRALVADMMRGSQAIRDMMAHDKDIGGVVGDEQLHNLRTMANAINDIKVAWQGVSAQIIGSLAPVITQFLEETASWFQQNKDLIQTLLVTSLSVLITLFKAALAAVSAFGSVLRAALHGDVGAIALISLLAAVLITVLVPALAAVAAAAWAAFLPLLVPTLIIAAVIALAAIIIYYWDEIVAALKAAWKSVTDELTNEWAWIKSKLNALVEWFSFVLYKLMKGLGDLWDWVKQKNTAFWSSLEGIVQEVGNWFVHLGDIIANAFISAWDWLAKKAKEALDYVVNEATSAWKKIRELPVISWIVDHVSGGSPPSGSGQVGGSTAQSSAVAGAPDAVAAASVPVGTRMVTNVPSAYASAFRQGDSERAAGQSPANVTVAGSTVNIYGVKDAAQAQDHILDAIDNQNRHVAAALGGEVV